jgi:hypothetical protein
MLVEPRYCEYVREECLVPLNHLVMAGFHGCVPVQRLGVDDYGGLSSFASTDDSNVPGDLHSKRCERRTRPPDKQFGPLVWFS